MLPLITGYLKSTMLNYPQNAQGTCKQRIVRSISFFDRSSYSAGPSLYSPRVYTATENGHWRVMVIVFAVDRVHGMAVFPVGQRRGSEV
jgi:hypothetical protein